MARVHWWTFLVNEEGQPIDNADVSIYLAGTSTAATLYLDEFSSTTSSTAPQLATNTNGYFEFWVADSNSSNGYDSTQKFKVSWDKAGVESGFIDYVDVFATVISVDESSTDTTKDKAVSNYLANLWENHRLDTTHIIHGIDEVNTSSDNTTKNRLISNSLGFDWSKHNSLTFSTSAISGDTYVTGTSASSGDYPHGIKPIDLSENLLSTTINYWKANRLISYHYAKKWNDKANEGDVYEVDENDTDTTKDKLVSNYIINDLYNQSLGNNTVTTVSTSAHNLQSDDDILHVSYTNIDTVAITLLSSEADDERIVYIKDAGGNASVNNITVDTEGAESIDGAATATINTDYGKLKLYCKTNNWYSL